MIPRPGKRWPRRSSQPKTIEKRPGTTPLSGSLSVPGESASWAGMMNAKQVAGIRQPLPAFVESFASELGRSASGRSDALRWICSISSSRSCRPIARSCSMPATVACCRCWRSWSSGASRMSPRFPGTVAAWPAEAVAPLGPDGPRRRFKIADQRRKSSSRFPLPALIARTHFRRLRYSALRRRSFSTSFSVQPLSTIFLR